MTKQQIKKQAQDYAIQVMTMRHNYDEVQEFINKAELELFDGESLEIAEFTARNLFSEDESDALNDEQFLLNCLQVIESAC